MNKAKKRKRMKEMVEVMEAYWSTYANQRHYLDYDKKTFLADALYIIGVALNEKEYMYADGFRRFKCFLKDLLDNES